MMPIATRVSLRLLGALWFFLFALVLPGQGEPVGRIPFERDDTLEEIRAKIDFNGYAFSVKDYGRTFNHEGRHPGEARLRGTLPGPGGVEIPIPETIPEEFDRRNMAGRTYIGPIRDQGPLGTCYAFAACAAAECAYNVSEDIYDDLCADFSESYVAWSLGSLHPYDDHFYGGTGADYEYFELFGLTVPGAGTGYEGVCSESDFPYTGSDPTSEQIQASYAFPRVTFRDWFRVAPDDYGSTTLYIKAAIMEFGAVDAAVYASGAFQAYGSGVYEDTNTEPTTTTYWYSSTNHAIALVGWDDTPPEGGGCWILRNSWGTGWGEGGYMRIRYRSARVNTSGAGLVYEAGSLIVTISPPEAVTAVAQWRRVGTATWFDSDTSETVVLAGTHIVEFSSVVGWGAPSTQSVTVYADQMTTAGATYVRQTGALQVTIAPPEAVTAGAQWRRQGTTPWLDGGTTETSIPTGDYTVEFSPVAGWDVPTTQSVTICTDQTTTAGATYVRQNGSLQVTIAPPEAVTAGAQWRRQGTTPWLDGGTTETSIPTGDHTVEFSPVADWDVPTTQSVTIHTDQMTTASATYVRQTGLLYVTIAPPEAVTAGAQWRRQGTTLWLDGGTTETAIPTGDYTVEFSPVADWDMPTTQSVTICTDQTTTAGATYVRQNGSLQVTIAPPEAVTAGAQWRRQGTTPWLDGGTTETSIPTGDHTVEFSPVADWDVPTTQSVTIHTDQMTTASATYVRQTGLLYVTIAPPEAVTAGAQWRRQGTTLWLDGGTTETAIPTGDYTVEFSPVADWDMPTTQSVTICTDQMTTAGATYVRQTGSLYVTIAPPEAVAAGAHWRQQGTTPWLDGGTTETSIPTGDYTVEFSPVADWDMPTTQSVTICTDQTTTAGATYVRQNGSLYVTIAPPEAVAAGAHWRQQGTTLWLDSGTTETAIPTGDYTVEFSPVAGWDMPTTQSVTIHTDQTTTASASHVRQTGSLCVMIAPPEAVTAGAHWWRQGTTLWLDSGTTETAIPTGDYTVEFSPLAGWDAPTPRNVTVGSGQTNQASGQYTFLSSSPTNVESESWLLY